MEEIEEGKKHFEKAGRYLAEERKWISEVISRIDIVPEEGSYYDPLALKPGFDFFYALINCPKEALDKLRINIPEILYFNQISYLLHNDSNGKIRIQESPKTEDFLKMIEAKAKYDIAKNENEPACVLRKATEHPCYTNVNLLNWRQTYETVRVGPPNRTMIQRYQHSFGDRMTIFRAVVHPFDLVNKKGPQGKHNFCYAMTNRLPFKGQFDEEDLFLYQELEEIKREQEKQKLLADRSKKMALTLEGKVKGLKYSQSPPKEDPVEEEEKPKTDDERRKEALFLKNRFESRYLSCPFNVGSFDVFTYVGKSMSEVEREAYKVFDFMHRTFDMKLLSLVTDWIRDAGGTYWFLGVKSYMLTEEGYDTKVHRPTVFDREMLALNKLKRPSKSKRNSSNSKYN